MHTFLKEPWVLQTKTYSIMKSKDRSKQRMWKVLWTDEKKTELYLPHSMETKHPEKHGGGSIVRTRTSKPSNFTQTLLRRSRNRLWLSVLMFHSHPSFFMFFHLSICSFFPIDFKTLRFWHFFKYHLQTSSHFFSSLYHSCFLFFSSLAFSPIDFSSFSRKPNCI